MFDIFTFKTKKDIFADDDFEERIDKLVAEQLKEKMQAELAEADFVIDFNRLNPFSVERIVDANNIPKTVFGYFDGNGAPREWYLWCSLEMHQRLANDFREYIHNKYNEVD